MFDKTSRYATVRTVVVPAPGGGTRVMTTPRIAPSAEAAARTAVRAGARLDLLGAAFTGDSTRWWVLADANPWADASVLEIPGTVIDLPGR